MEFEVIFMELYQQILFELLYREPMEITFPNLKMDPTKIVEGVCYQTLKKLKQS